jgi:hypothetical protein
VVVFMVGANDRQDLVLHGVERGPDDPAWRREYRRRVATVMRTVAAQGRRLVWVGMPPMRDPGLSSAMAALDRIFAAEASRHPGVTYIDPAAVLGGPGGAYADSLPDPSGRPEAVRAGDGVHLSVAGSRRLAARIMAAVLTPLADHY